MSRAQVVRCDVCGAEKKLVNRWWIVQFNAGGSYCSIFAWSDSIASEPASAHLCGEKCVLQKVSEFMGAK